MTYSGNSDLSQYQINTTSTDGTSVFVDNGSGSSIPSNLFPNGADTENGEPEVGESVETVPGKVWVWDGNKWVLQFDKANLEPAERGPVGPSGLVGPEGPSGLIGGSGATGLPGRGDTGPSGATGDEGRPGATGPMGAAIAENTETAPNSGIRGKLFIDKYNQIYITLGQEDRHE